MKKIGIIILVLCFNVSLYNIIYSSLILKIISGLSLLLGLGVLLLDFVITKNKQKKLNDIIEKKEKSKKEKSELRMLYDKYFEKNSYKEIFDEKIFPLIDLVNELLEESSLKGVFKARISELVSSSLKLYSLNVKHAIKMKKASKAGLDFDEDIKALIKQNLIIKDSMKEFFMKLLTLDENSSDFNDLIKSFEDSLKTLSIIKNKRNP